MESVVQNWVSQCSFKQQTVLFSAIRGCDGVSNDDYSKRFIKLYRSHILKNAAVKEDNNDFMKSKITHQVTTVFVKDIEKYPLHWVLHFIDAIKIVSFYHPDDDVKLFWTKLYNGIVNKMNLYPETKEQCDERLKDNR